jgi:hypothetical protein
MNTAIEQRKCWHLARDDLATRKHPLLAALDSPDPGDEMNAWKVFLTELPKVT